MSGISNSSSAGQNLISASAQNNVQQSSELNPEPSVISETVFSATQIDKLQKQIRHFKNLGVTFKESDIPRQLETLAKAEFLVAPSLSNDVPPPHAQQQIRPQQNASVQSLQRAAQKGFSTNPSLAPVGIVPVSRISNSQDAKPPSKAKAKSTSKKQSKIVEEQQAPRIEKDPAVASEAVAAQQAPVLSWQCVNAVLSHESISADRNVTSSIGCFLKSATAPLVLTTPYVAELREKLLSGIVPTGAGQLLSDSNAAYPLSSSTMIFQRLLRSQLVHTYLQQAGVQTFVSSTDYGLSGSSSSSSNSSLHPPLSLGVHSYTSELAPYRVFFRTKRQQKRDVKLWERDDRKRRAEVDSDNKKRIQEFAKTLLSHREEFNRFHRTKRTECTKIAKLAKAHVDSIESRKERDGAKAERERISALEKNDMEAYVKLVQDTKNGRLKHLLNETDSYLVAINRMIEDQRVISTDAISSADANAAQLPHHSSSNVSSSSSSDSGETTTTASKQYNRSIHRNMEEVYQPALLKGGTLKEYQVTGLQWLVSLYNNNLNGILADEMGLGKTIQTISLIAYLMEKKHNNGPFLVVVPLSTISNWMNEFRRWAPDIVVVVYKGTPDGRKKIFKENVEPGLFNVLVTTYEYIIKDKASLKKVGWQYIIVDEGHRMKNAHSKFSQVLGSVYTSRNRILLTGTPLQNDLPELWSLLNFLLPKIFNSVETFDQWFNKPFSSFRNPTAPQQQAATDADSEQPAGDFLSQEERLLIVHRLHEVLRPFVLRRVKSQVLSQLPEKVEKVLRCNLSGWQRKMYQTIVAKGLASKEKDGPGGGLNNIIMQLRKVCNHPFLFLNHYNIDEFVVRSAGKFSLLDRMLPKLKANNHRVLIFSQMVETMNILEEFFHLRSFRYLRLDGSTTADEREKRVFLFNQPESPYFIFLLSTRAGGLGINLATADTVIIFDSDWNPSMDAQAQDRAHRIGQKKEVRVFRLLTNTPVEERILSRATDKNNLTNLVVNAGGFNARGGSAGGKKDEEMMAMLLNELSSSGAVGPSNTSAENPEEQDYDASMSIEEIEQMEDDAINEMMASDADELQMYRQIDAEYRQRREEHWKHMNQAVAAAGGPIPPLPPRLMHVAEHPHWLTEECWPTKYVTVMRDMMNLASKKPGRKPGSGRKSGMVYLTADKKAAAEAAALINNGEADGGDDSDDDDVDNKGEGGRHSVFKMRKRKGVKYSDGMTERQFVRFVERQEMEENPDNSAQMSSGVRKKRFDALIGTVFRGLLDLLRAIQKIRMEDGSYLTALFEDQPPAEVYPEYYVAVKQPIALGEIIMQVKKMGYSFLEEVELDLALMSHNARTFNTAQSFVFELSETIRREFYNRIEEVRSQYEVEAAAPYVTELDAVAPNMPLLPSDTHLIFGEYAQFTAELSKLHSEGSSESRQKRKYVRRNSVGDDQEGGDGESTDAPKQKRKYVRKSYLSTADGDDDGAAEEESGDGNSNSSTPQLKRKRRRRRSSGAVASKNGKTPDTSEGPRKKRKYVRRTQGQSTSGQSDGLTISFRRGTSVAEDGSRAPSAASSEHQGSSAADENDDDDVDDNEDDGDEEDVDEGEGDGACEDKLLLSLSFANMQRSANKKSHDDND